MNAGDIYLELQAGLPARLRSYWDAAEVEFVQPYYEAPAMETDAFGVLDIVAPFLACEGRTKLGKHSAYGTKPCVRRAGEGTVHDGIGLCSTHGGNYGKGKAVGAVLMAMAYADEMNISPWEALLKQVKLLANQVEWLRQQVAMAEVLGGAAALLPGGTAFDLVEMLDRRGDRLAKVSKMAIDAGVAERMIRQIELEAELMVRAARHALSLSGLDDDAQALALERMGAKLLELEASNNPWPDRENA